MKVYIIVDDYEIYDIEENGISGDLDVYLTLDSAKRNTDPGEILIECKITDDKIAMSPVDLACWGDDESSDDESDIGGNWFITKHFKEHFPKLAQELHDRIEATIFHVPSGQEGATIIQISEDIVRENNLKPSQKLVILGFFDHGILKGNILPGHVVRAFGKSPNGTWFECWPNDYLAAAHVLES